ncbi:methyltransferase domain-containing protein [Dactylosporangium sucinum]|uniref:Methyltransferase n=1 Tax=Dactylosporangium sucinum TaxID=1424081 RepID=A0A917U2U1_9ACTN|nr:methyltransferase domain-containing protein [Dactylosporangium sucinum]GGM54069.1 methyltransferase [Dactylosporangium sucinum]
MDGWLDDTRTSYDTVAGNYAELVRDSLEREPYLTAALALFAALAGPGPVADVGCGPGHVTAHLRGLGADAFGIDLSPAMVELARRAHPGTRFETGDMTGLALEDGSLAGLLTYWSTIHVPDELMPAVCEGFHRALRPGGVLLAGFHAGDSTRLKTEGYGGLPMRVYVHRRSPAKVSAWLREAGFAVEAEWLLDPAEPATGALVFARRPA